MHEFSWPQSASGESLKLGQDTPADSPTSLLDQALKYCQQLVKPQVILHVISSLKRRETDKL